MTRIPALLVTAALCWPALTAPLGAQEYIRSLTLSGGIAGSIDEDETGFSNPVVQLRFAVETSPRGNLGIRLGRMDFDDATIRDRFTQITVDYLTVGGEYIFDEPSHTSGLYLGLGFFDLDAVSLDGVGGDEGSVGGVIGAFGEFAVAKRWFIYGEGFAAYTGLDVAQIFANLQVGVGYRF